MNVHDIVPSRGIIILIRGRERHTIVVMMGFDVGIRFVIRIVHDVKGSVKTKQFFNI